MKIFKQIVLGILNFIFRFSVAALVVMLVYRLAMYSYHFGYMVFADASKDPAPGRDIVITAENTEDIMALGKLLQSRGLIEDAKIFLVQERLSEYHGKLVPGTYTLNTSMKAGDMLAMMAADYTEETETVGEDSVKKLDDSSNTETVNPAENGGYYDPETGEYIEPESGGSADPVAVTEDQAVGGDDASGTGDDAEAEADADADAKDSDEGSSEPSEASDLPDSSVTTEPSGSTDAGTSSGPKPNNAKNAAGAGAFSAGAGF